MSEDKILNGVNVSTVEGYPGSLPGEGEMILRT